MIRQTLCFWPILFYIFRQFPSKWRKGQSSVCIHYDKFSFCPGCIFLKDKRLQAPRNQSFWKKINLGEFRCNQFFLLLKGTFVNRKKFGVAFVLRSHENVVESHAIFRVALNLIAYWHIWVSSGWIISAEAPICTVPMANFKFHIWKILCKVWQRGKSYAIMNRLFFSTDLCIWGWVDFNLT